MAARRECRVMLPASGWKAIVIPATCINASFARFLEAAKDALPMAVQVQMHPVSRDRFGNAPHAVSDNDIKMARQIL